MINAFSCTVADSAHHRPDPGAGLLVLAGGLPMLGRRRRRRASAKILEGFSCLLPSYPGGGLRWGLVWGSTSPHPSPPPEYQGRG